MRNLRGSMLVAAVLFAGAPAVAGDQMVDLSTGAASFIGTSIVFDGGDDVITFTGLPAGVYDFVFSLEAQYISTDLTATLNGDPAATTALPGTPFVFAGLVSTGSTPFILTLAGTAASNARYTGTLQTTLVPEPTTALMLLFGLGGIGVIGRRRAASA